MKLLPKARPVQINKLRLGGKDINTMDDLLKNFCVPEILALGSKFTKWLDRHADAKQFAAPVSAIMNAKNTKKKQTTDLLYLFFPKFKGKSLDDIFLLLNGNTAEMQLLVNIVNYIDPNVKNAIELMRKFSDNYQGKAHFFDWLENCSIDGEKSSDFCFLYGKFLKSVYPESSDKWIKKASQMGNRQAKKELEAGEIKEIKIKDCVIKMVLIHSNSGDFYISERCIDKNLFNQLRLEKCNDNAYERKTCDSAMQKMGNISRVNLIYPTYEQMKEASKSIHIDGIYGVWIRDMNPDGKRRWGGSVPGAEYYNYLFVVQNLPRESFNNI